MLHTRRLSIAPFVLPGMLFCAALHGQAALAIVAGLRMLAAAAGGGGAAALCGRAAGEVYDASVLFSSQQKSGELIKLDFKLKTCIK